MKCYMCGKLLEDSEGYEYRGAYSCDEHFEETVEARDRHRSEIIKEESAKTKCFKGLDMSDSAIGKANREILKRQIEIASKESPRLKKYERGDD